MPSTFVRQYLIDEYPVVDLDAAPNDEVDDRLDPDADDREITIDTTAASGDDPFDASTPSKRVATSSNIVSTPWSRCVAAITCPDLLPRTRNNGVGDGSMVTTSTPFWRSDAATSHPMNPMPITSAFRPDTILLRRASRR